MRRISILVATLAVLAAPATAWAQDNSAVDEYQEHVPGARGDRPSDEVGGGGGGSLPPGSAAALQARGSDGAAAAALAEATSQGSRGSGDGQGPVAAAGEAGGLPSIDEIV